MSNITLRKVTTNHYNIYIKKILKSIIFFRFLFRAMTILVHI